MTAEIPFTVIVPARLASSRLPGKPLLDLGGEPMLVRVLRRCRHSGAEQVIAAVEEQELFDAVTQAGFTAVKTGAHSCGSARIAEAVSLLALPDSCCLVNVQGDEPFIEPALIAAVAELLMRSPDCVCATACRPLRNAAEYEDAAAVKVVCDKNHRALYFSRRAIPANATASAQVHMGIYAYRAAYLNDFAALPPPPMETAEQLEQLRILWHGGRIAVLPGQSDSFGIDTPADLERARARIAAGG